MIYHDFPEDWQDLQERVAQIFKDIGLNTIVGKIIKTVRGQKEIDVFAIDKSHKPKIIYLCECKNWNNPVPQEVVHSFRTVVQDYGANYGLIISRNGFQSGAYEAATRTNIVLLNWIGFQKMFETRWLRAAMAELGRHHNSFINYTSLRSIAKYIDEIDTTDSLSSHFKRFSPEQKYIFADLMTKYDALDKAAKKFYFDVSVISVGHLAYQPLITKLPATITQPLEIIEITVPSYKELLTLMISNFDALEKSYQNSSRIALTSRSTLINSKHHPKQPNNGL